MSKFEQLNQAHEMMRFRERYSNTKIYATYVLLACILVVFLLEEYFGGSKDVFVLVSMGANVGEFVKQGEYYRLLSLVFLHAGFLHVFFNIYVLFALGGFFNRIFGDAKFLCIFFVSGLTGSLASIYIGSSQVSVGASGAIWGLFGASISIAFLKNKLIPDMLRARLRRITLINLVINLGVSFLPMVDMWAHFGGGIGGLLVSLLFLLPEKNKINNSIKLYFFRIGAVVFGLFYLGALLSALGSSQPWVNQFEINLTPRQLEGVPFVVGIPKNLAPKKIDQKLPDAHTYIFGDLRKFRFAVELQFFNILNLSSDQNPQDWIKDQKESMMQNPKISAEVKKTVHIKQNWNFQVLSYYSPTKNNLEVFNYVLLKDKFVIKLVVISGGKNSQKPADTLAKKIVGSLSDN